MLSRNAKKILKITKRTAKKAMAYEDMKQVLGWDYDKIHSACDQLIQKNLAKEKAGIALPGWRGSSAWGIVLSEEGRSRWVYTAEELTKFLIKSVLVPIGVSILTTLLTMFVTWLLSGQN